MGAIRSRIIIAPVILSIAAGIMMVTRHRTRPDLTNAAISALGVVVTPQTVVVERTSPGSPAYVKFTLENIGHNAVRVESVDTTCGCSVAQPMADQIILARKRQQLAIVTDPPMFGSRNVAVHLGLADAKDASRTDEIWLQLKLVGKALAASRVYDIPKMIEVSSASSSEVSRQFEIKTVEENATRNWITGLSPTVPNIRADIIDSKTELRPNNRVYRTYVCRLIIDIPQEIEDTRAATVNLVSAVETAPVV